MKARSNRTHKILRYTAPFLLATALLLGLWEIGIYVCDIPPYLLPRPTALLERLWTDTPKWAPHLGLTAAAAAIGFSMGSIIGWLSAVVFSLSRSLRFATYPYFVALKAVPIVVIAPFVALWFGTDLTSRVVVVAATCFFPTLVNTLKGLESSSRDLLELLETYHAGRWQLLVKVRIPVSLPFLVAGMKVSVVLAVVAALVAEMLGADSGLGFVLMISIYRTDTEALFCVTILSAATTLIFFSALQVLERFVCPWLGAFEAA